MARKPYTHHFIYKTTCSLTNRYYVGMHSTDNLDDGYLGSGKRLWYSVRKHGRDNHVREILEFLPDRKSLASREKELITEEMRHDINCMNLAAGGIGGFNNPQQHKNATKASFTPEAISKRVISFKKTREIRMKDAEYRLKIYNALSESHKGKTAFLGKTHSEEAKRKMSASLQGKQEGVKNSQFGTCWINDSKKAFKIKKDNLDEMISLGYFKGRKILPD